MINQRIILLMFLGTYMIWLLTKGVIRKVFKVENYANYKKRQKQLKFEKKKKFDTQTEELIHIGTSPILKFFGNFIGEKNKEKITRELIFVGWDKYLDYKTYKALSILFTIIGIIVFLIVLSGSSIFASLCLIVFIGLMPYLLSHEVKDKRMKLLAEFPDFIRVVQGYLSSGLTFVYALEASLRFLGDDWKPFITDLVVDMKLTNTRDALERFKAKVDLREVKEFVSIIVLALDQGGEVKDAFEAQARGVQVMLTDIMEKKVVMRNVYGQALQPFLLIAMLIAYALPMAINMMKFGSMGL